MLAPSRTVREQSAWLWAVPAGPSGCSYLGQHPYSKPARGAAAAAQLGTASAQQRRSGGSHRAVFPSEGEVVAASTEVNNYFSSSVEQSLGRLVHGQIKLLTISQVTQDGRIFRMRFAELLWSPFSLDTNGRFKNLYFSVRKVE